MRLLCFSFILLLFCSTGGLAAEGLISVESPHSVSVTAERLETALKRRGLNLFNRIDHAAGAAGAGQELRPTTLILFGSPAVGTPLIQCQQTIGIDMPQKVLIWEDAGGKVWFSYNDPQYLVKRHQAGDCGAVVQRIQQALANFARVVTEN